MSNLGTQAAQNRESARDKSSGRFGSYQSGESRASLIPERPQVTGNQDEAFNDVYDIASSSLNTNDVSGLSSQREVGINAEAGLVFITANYSDDERRIAHLGRV